MRHFGKTGKRGHSTLAFCPPLCELPPYTTIAFMEHSRIPNRLVSMRKAALLLQKDVGQILDLQDVSTIVRWEKGRVFPGGLHLIALCQLYRASPEFLYPEIWSEVRNTIDKNKAALFSEKKSMRRN
jgi:DNA-binding XRE family transcriptional regulator